MDPSPFASPDPLHGGPAYMNVPMLDETNEAAAAALNAAPTMAAVYALILDGCLRRVAEIFAALAAAPSGGVLVYCHAGKDRTGIVAALALAAVGVPAEAIAADYALSDRSLQPLYDGRLREVEDPAGRRRLEERLRSPLNAAEPETMIATLAHLENRYGGAAEYLRAGGLTPRDLGRVRARLRQ